MAENLCPNCKARNRDTAKYCSECGAALLSDLPPAPGKPGEAPKPPTAATLVGKTLVDRYQIEDELGRGGFGAVYRATDTRLNRTCAVKENLDVSKEAQRQFAREATVLANLYHPHLPRVTDHFSIPDQGQYLVMDYVEGIDLSNLIDAAQNIPPEQSVTWISQVLDALEYMHSKTPPILHRDIKPANIRITPTGKAMLVDFGLVKVYDPKLKTTLGARAVTPGYAPPEQYGHGSTDVRTDIYALGATLFALLTRVGPLESVQRMMGKRMLAAHEADSSIPAPIGRVIEHAMALEPGKRYQSAADFKAALQDALEASKADSASATMIAEPPFERTPASIQTVAVASEPQAIPEPGAPATQVAELPKARSGSSRRWFVIGIGLFAAIVLCLGAVLSLVFLVAGDDGQTTATPLAQATTEAPVVIEATATPDQQLAAAMQQAQQTAAAQATATEEARVSRTARAQATFTANAGSTATAGAQLEATQQAISTMKEAGELKFGPRDGLLVHDSDDYLEESPSSPGIRNFIAEAKLFNPYSTSKGTWDYGLVFRSEGGNNQYRLIITSDRVWNLKLTAGENPNGRLIHEGSISSLDIQEGGSNSIQLIAIEDEGWFYVNGELISKLDLSGRYSGSVYVVTGFFVGSEMPGQMTKYEGFTIWAIK